MIECSSWTDEVIDDFNFDFIPDGAFEDLRSLKGRRRNITTLVFQRFFHDAHIDLKWKVGVFQCASIDIPKRLLIIVPCVQNRPGKRGCIRNTLFTLITHLEIEIVEYDWMDCIAAADAADAADTPTAAAAASLGVHFLCKEGVFLIGRICLAIILDIVDAVDFRANERKFGLSRFLVNELVLYFQ